MRVPVVVAVIVVLSAGDARGEPLRMRHVESTSHGFTVVHDAGGTPIAHGEVTQWIERGVLTHHQLISFDDGSVYDETLRYTQQPTLRIQSYRLIQRGPSFTVQSDVQFERSGRYSARNKKEGDDEKTSSGTTTIPPDTYNGLNATVLKNLRPAAAATWHIMAFTPEPHVLEVHATVEGSERYKVGSTAGSSTRWLMTPRVPGVMGALATVAGKQPPDFRMWIADGKAPAFVRFEGPLYAEGPQWRIELAAPRWK